MTNTSLRKQLVESHTMCGGLKQRVEEVSGMLDDMLYQESADSQVKVQDASAERVSDLKKMLTDVADLTNFLETNLEG